MSEGLEKVDLTLYNLFKQDLNNIKITTHHIKYLFID